MILVVGAASHVTRTTCATGVCARLPLRARLTATTGTAGTIARTAAAAGSQFQPEAACGCLEDEAAAAAAAGVYASSPFSADHDFQDCAGFEIDIAADHRAEPACKSCDQGPGLVAGSDDLSRIPALGPVGDKVIGAALGDGCELKRACALESGRLTHDGTPRFRLIFYRKVTGCLL